MSCCCMEACPQFTESTGFVGAATISQVRGVLVARKNGAAFLLSPIGGADLDKLRLGGNRLCHVRRKLRLIAGRIGASVALPAKVVAKQEIVVSGALRAVGATAR